LGGTVKQKVIVSFAIIGPIQLLARQQIVSISFAAAYNIDSINGHGRAIVGGVVGTTGFKGIISVQTGLDHKNTPCTHSAVPNINRIGNGVQVGVEGKIKVRFKPKIDFLEIRISVGTI
jgi:hypothetical protein